MKEFKDKSHLLIARSLSDMMDGFVWFRVLNPTLEQKMRLFSEEITTVRSLCTKYEEIILQNSTDMGFCDRIDDEINLKMDAVPFRHTYGCISFEKKKSHEKKV